jgi:hypothetical protein
MRRWLLRTDPGAFEPVHELHSRNIAWIAPSAGSTRFPGRHPHYTTATFDTVEQVLAWCDPHREHIWEQASDPDENY